jgi:hypothetical protein
MEAEIEYNCDVVLEAAKRAIKQVKEDAAVAIAAARNGSNGFENPEPQQSKQVQPQKKKAVVKEGAAAATAATVTYAGEISNAVVRIEVLAGPSGH